MNPKCCSIPLKRGWSYCPECAESIDWETKAQKLARRKKHERRMKTDPVYREKKEREARFLAPMWDAHMRAFLADSDPFLKINRINPEAPASLEGMEG